MNDIFEETFEKTGTEKQTPIEIALGVDNQGMTTARKLYAFLELRPGNFARWCKVNIIENQFAEENTDYLRFLFNEETPTGGKIQREDYKLSASFAKKLSMMQKNEKGEAARNYFVGIENGAKKLARKVSLTEHPGEVANLIKVLSNRMDKQGSAPYKACEMAQMICSQYGIRLPDDFVKASEYEQMRLSVI